MAHWPPTRGGFLETPADPPEPLAPHRTESQRLRSILLGDHARRLPLAELTDDNFVTEVLDVKGLVVFDFWSRQCKQCSIMLERMQRLAEHYAGKARFGRIEVDKNPELVRAFNLKAIPHLVATIDGDVVLEVVGSQTFEVLRDRLASFVAAAEGR